MCWLKNPARQPAWFKKKQEKAANNEVAAVQMDDGPNINVLFCSVDVEKPLTFPPAFAMLNDPNVFIADTGASAHSTGYSIGLFDMKSTGENEGVMNPDGTVNKTAKIAKLKGTVCSNQGAKLLDITMENVNYVPEQRLNLFSLTKALDGGWSIAWQ
jgi:hypothetical protein